MTASSAQIILSVILLFKLQDVISTDYWTDDFDASKNCDNEEEIARLSNLTPTQCVRVQVIDDEEKAFLQCKAILGGKIQEKCKDKKINNPGRLFYCKDRGHIACCHRNTTCFSWNNIQTQLYIDAKEYLMNKKKELARMVEEEGYKSCHPIDSSLDATECAEDCKKFETEKFGKNCTKNGGLFKCCIRRDKKFCHECRFCCTLPMCTYEPGNKKDTYFDIDNKSVELRDQNRTEMGAIELFFQRGFIVQKNLITNALNQVVMKIQKSGIN